ncbi:MAG: GspH/FimT family protein [Phycisphaerales bacterium]
MHRRRPGFSLMELVTVVAIMAIMAAIAMPRMAEAAARRDLDAAAQRLVADLRHAQQHALASSTNISVTFNTDSDGYTVDAPDPISGAASYTVDLAVASGRADLRASTLAGGVATFDANGLATTTGVIEFGVGRYRRSVTITDGSLAIDLSDITYAP